MHTRTRPIWHRIALGCYIVGLPIVFWLTSARPCHVDATLLTLLVTVDGQAPRIFQVLPNGPRYQIELHEANMVRVVATLETQPPGCHGNFTIDWRLLFSNYTLRMVRMDNYKPNEGQLLFQLGPQSPNIQGEDLIQAIVRDEADTSVQSVFIVLKGQTR